MTLTFRSMCYAVWYDWQHSMFVLEFRKCFAAVFHFQGCLVVVACLAGFVLLVFGTRERAS